VSCQEPLSGESGVFCTNLLSRRATSTPCQKAWCRNCYTIPMLIPFSIRASVDDEGFDQTFKGNKLGFKGAHNGDHLTCPFQCDLCHIRNLQKKEPVPSLTKDKLLLQSIWQASIDAFWSRETSTVNVILGEPGGCRKFETV
jgi:hypothetical protein